MQNRIVDVSSQSIHLSVHRGFLKLSKSGEEIGRVAIDDMAAVIIRGFGVTLSANLCARMAGANIPVVICGPDQSPASYILPVSGHHKQGERIAAQAAAGKPLQKRLWQHLISAKITAQGRALELCGQVATDLFEIAGRVRSGDPDNQEAMAARRYWRRMLGPEGTGDPFTRSRESPGANAALNYGYTVLRACAARSIITAGLSPSLSIHHQSRGDALRLADDIMEPFRPYVDLCVRSWVDENETHKDIESLDALIRSRLVDVLTMDMEGPYGAAPLQTCMDRLAASLAQVYLGERQTLELPGRALITAAVHA